MSNLPEGTQLVISIIVQLTKFFESNCESQWLRFRVRRSSVGPVSIPVYLFQFLAAPGME